jgi:hypothetical protein
MLQQILVCLLAVAFFSDIASADNCVDIRDYGAIEGNPGGEPGNWEVNTKAIQAALDDAGNSINGIDCVRISGGDYASTDIFIRSNTKFIIDAGSRLIQAANTGQVLTSLVNLQSAENVEIAGEGTIYGNAENFIDYYSVGDNRFEPVVEGRPATLVRFNYSSNIFIHDIKLLNSSNWNLHIRSCHNVTVDSLYIYGDERFPNNDGIDPDSSTDVVIRNTYIDVADDAICPKASKGAGPLLNLLVTNCTLRSRSHAIKFGTNCEEEMAHIMFENIKIWDSNSGLAIQSRNVGGSIHNITWRNIDVETRYVAARWWGNGEWLYITADRRHDATEATGPIYDLKFENIVARSENGGFVVSETLRAIDNVQFTNVSVVIDRWGNYSSGVGPEGNPCQRSATNSSEAGANVVQCMGMLDLRPSHTYYNCGNYCRTASRADGFKFINVRNVRLTDVSVVFATGSSPLTTPAPDYWGKCINIDRQCGDVITENFKCSTV